MSNYINSHLAEEQILGQLMEECAELIQAAHKIIRQRQGVNLPHTDHPLVDDLEEEIADVMLCVMHCPVLMATKSRAGSSPKRPDGKRG